MIYKKVLTLLSGREAWVNLKDYLHVFKLFYSEDITIEQDCLTLMAGFEIEGELIVDGCLEVF